ncbi:MAG TPA: PA4780 family RIO1-like protein kinase [Pseudomonadales bacterium]|jgi:RIO kinase 1|nr:PA4780 family RIO1-like protein kinase [Pseudomonadales bacterium]HNI37211.1 PA4780 family RIO1-like protein kinase [Pseudomonadales bacterium]
MKIPERLKPLIEDGIIDDVLRQLKSGKEAAVYLVQRGEHVRCAKVYKEVERRSFRQAAEYTEGRKSRNSRRARAMEKGSRYGKQEQEAAWQTAEADALYRLSAVGMRVPRTYGFFEGVLLMDVIEDADGQPAPRLNDVLFSADEARQHHTTLIQEVVRMLCAGLVHGDLSEFNILLAADGPIIIDFPQAVDAAQNNHAASLLERDVQNLADFFGRFAPELLETRYGKEIWSLYAKGELTPETALTGRFADSTKKADVRGVLREIDAAIKEEMQRRERMQEQE